MNTLRLKVKINRFLDRIGWTQFITQALEFLRSLKMILRSHDKRDRGIIIFRLMGVDKMMNIYEFYIIYEFESTGF